MPATRKTPVAPAAPINRTNSTRGKGKATSLASIASTDLDGGIGLGNEARNSSANDTTSTSKHKSKSKKNKKGKKTKATLFDQLIRLLLVSFAVYSFAVCPHDEKLESNVCKGLSKYREYILEPYLFPAFHRLLAHPSITPQLERVAPYYIAAVRVSTPVVVMTQKEWKTRVLPQWNKRVVPQWNKRVVPQWNKHVVPQLLLVDQKVEPYRTIVTAEYNKYSSRVAPHIQLAQHNLQRWQRQAQPYIILAAAKTHQGYHTAKPYAIPLWNQFKIGLTEFLQFVKEQRVLFVDPHVARIWEKVIELSTGAPKSSGTVKGPSAPQAAAPPPHAEVVTPEAEAVPPTTGDSTVPIPATDLTEASFMGTAPSATEATYVEPAATETTTEEPIATAEEATEASTIAEPVPTAFEEPATGTVSETAIISVSESAIASALSSLTNSISIASTSTFSSSSMAEASPTIITTGLSKIVDPTPIPTPELAEEYTAEEMDLDMADLIRELGLEAIEKAPVVIEEAVAPPPPIQEMTNEEKAEQARLHKEEVLQKRTEILTRHNKWESELKELIKVHQKSLRKALVAVRKQAAADFKQSKKTSGSIDALHAEAEKYLKGAETYLKSLKKEAGSGSIKVGVWDKVIDKIEAKFQDRLKETESIVNGWYDLVLNQEAIEVQRATMEVSEYSGQAQANLGLDYAWLEGVTYDDWQKYHDLARISEGFTEQAQAIQKGTHPSPPTNPVVPLLEGLEADVQNIVDGFQTRLRQLKHEGASTVDSPSKESPDAASTSEPMKSILPIPEDEIKSHGSLGDVPPVVIGRSKEDVINALSRAGVGAIPSPSVKAESEEIVEQLAQEVSVESELKSPASPDAHVEL